MSERVGRETAAVDRLLQPEPGKYTLAELAEKTELGVNELRALWTSAGFADVADDERAFTEDDLAIAKDVADLIADDLVGADVAAAGARSMGQALYRLAELQAPLVIAANGQGGDPRQVMDRLDTLQNRLFRRHLATAAQRLLAADDEQTRTSTMAVGFADMVGYTSLSRGLAVSELNTLLAAFETHMQSVISDGGGWIVKDVGDEVMFAANDPADAALIALRLQEGTSFPELDAIDLEFPKLRVGVAYGEVLQRFGDLFGSVVNLASRLTSAARPGAVLIDEHLSEAVESRDDVRTRSLRPYRARGFRAVHPHLLRWK